MNRPKFLLMLVIGFIAAYLLTGGMKDAAYDSEPKAQLHEYDRAYSACLQGRGYTVK